MAQARLKVLGGGRYELITPTRFVEFTTMGTVINALDKAWQIVINSKEPVYTAPWGKDGDDYVITIPSFSFE